MTFFCSTRSSEEGALFAFKSTDSSDLKSKKQSNEIRLSLAVATGDTESKNDTIDFGHSKLNEDVMVINWR